VRKPRSQREIEIPRAGLDVPAPAPTPGGNDHPRVLPGPVTQPSPSLSSTTQALHWVTAGPRFTQRSRPVQTAYLGLKRARDVAAAATLLVTLGPVLLAVAAAVRIADPGPVLFRHRRLGLGGREFWCWKFRTMVVGADDVLRRDPELVRQFEVSFKLKDDPRTTRIGRFLRTTSLDELPQLYNVLCGEMSLIGPRPIVPPELCRYGPQSEKLLTVVPGLSGLWQACGRSETTYEERVDMDMAYIDHRSLALDGKLLLLTALSVFTGRRGC